MVDFCNKCGAIIIGKKGEAVNCPSCGHENKAKSTINLSEKIKKKEEIEVVDKDDSSAEIHPITDVECPKCGNPKAYFWSQQTRAADEPETQFFKCVKCKHQWRDYK
ncbi:MAG: transcription factor S [Nanoarchaeota archaeon]